MGNERPATPSAWSPLALPLFRALWLAGLASNVGTWMQNVGAAWLMTSLDPSPTMVALVQTATSLPIFLVAIPGGVLADVVDRRRLLLVTQGGMLAVALALSLLTFAGRTTPWLLLALTFALGLGLAMNLPAWQATVQELVPRAELPAAVTLNGVSINAARAIGPALGGLVVAAAGSGTVFLLNALSFVGVMLVLFRWRRPARHGVMSAERLAGGLRAGLRYVRHAPALRAVFVRSGIFILCASALWALLPVLARRELGVGAAGYGLLLGSVGAGAVIGAAFLPAVRAKVSPDTLVGLGTLGFAAVTLGLATLRDVRLLFPAMLAGGIAWIALMASFNVLAQTAAPSWVRARALAFYLFVFQGGMALGSALWGTVAGRWGTSVALMLAAGGLVAGLAASARWRLVPGEHLDLTPSLHWPEPRVVAEPHAEAGPVLVTLEYRIDPARSPDFVLAMQALGPLRRRDGAIRWRLYRDAADPTRYLETFVVESWAEHLRQHERVTVADRTIEDLARSFHVGTGPPLVSHFLAAYHGAAGPPGASAPPPTDAGPERRP